MKDEYDCEEELGWGSLAAILGCLVVAIATLLYLIRGLPL